METYRYSKHKLQTISIEFFIATVIFLAIITILTTFQITKMKELLTLYEDFSLIRDLRTLEVIFDIEGKPKNWNSSNFEVIGLRTSEKVDKNKINYLSQIDYSKIKENLMIRNEFCIFNFNIGNCNFNNSEKIFVTKKIVPIDVNGKVILEEIKIIVWS